MISTGVRIELFDKPEQNSGSLWLPDAGNMVLSGRHYYRVSFPDKKPSYKLHTEISWTFFQVIVPAHVRRWMSNTDPQLVVALRQYLSGQTDNHPFSKIIRDADMTSTARDLKSGSRQRFASAKRIPLIETVMETLREMLSERGRYFSIATAAGGDLFRRDDMVYMVSKNVPDNIRLFLRQNNHPAAASFPTENQRIFDTLLEYGAVLPNPQCEHRAVTAVDIVFKRNDGTSKSQRFTMLVFKLQTLYPEGNYPATFSGSLNVCDEQDTPTQISGIEAADIVATPITPIQHRQVEEGSADSSTAVETENIQENTNPTSLLPGSDSINNRCPVQAGVSVTADTQVTGTDTVPIVSEASDTTTVTDVIKQNPTEKTVKTVPKNNQSGVNILKELFTKSSPGTKNTLSSELPQQEGAAEGLAEIQLKRQSAQAQSPRPVSVYSSGGGPDKLTTIAALSVSEEQEPVSGAAAVEIGALADVRQRQQQDGRYFWRWLAEGLFDGSIAINCPGAPVHFVAQGMLLVSPAIFRDYAGGVFNKNDENCPELRAQRGFVSLKLHQRTKSSSLFNIETGKGVRKRLFCCYLIPECNLYHIIRADSRPPNNIEICIT